MLTFKLERSDLSLTWKPTASGWSAGQSCLEPFRHPALEDYAVATDDRLLIVVRERCGDIPKPAWAGQPNEVPHVQRAPWDEVLSDALKWPLQTTVFVASLEEGEPRITIVSGCWGTAPIYVIMQDDVARGHWDPISLYPYLSDGHVDLALASNFIATFDVPYSRWTMFPEMQMLTERSRATWGRGPSGRVEFNVEYPPRLRAPRAGGLKPDADVLGEFWNILTLSMRRWLPSGDRTAGSELSGGLDSGIVSAAAAELVDCPLETFGVILLGEMGEAQRARRLEMVRRFGFSDETVEMDRLLPLGPGSSRWSEGVVHWEDCYSEAMGEVLDAAQKKGVRLLFTGLGGDELCGARRYELDPDGLKDSGIVDEGEVEDALPAFLSDAALQTVRDTRETLERAPRSIICSSSLEAVACSSAMSMRRGIWHVNPLCTPELIRFCSRLPLKWRQERAVERRLVSWLGCSDNVASPPEDDDFSPACRRSMRSDGRFAVAQLFRESRLAEMGIVEQDRLRADYDKWCAGNETEGDLPFYSVAVLELNLRSIEESRPVAAGTFAAAPARPAASS